jgi:Domain of unknown function (DUF3817)
MGRRGHFVAVDIGGGAAQTAGGLAFGRVGHGPIHGAAFVGYVLMIMLHAGKGHLSARAVPLLMLAAFVPFGAWFVGSLFRTPDKK